jgi:hypothetical protein
MTTMDIGMKEVLKLETHEVNLQRQTTANMKLVDLRHGFNQRNWNIHRFMATVTILIEQDHADINTTSYKGNTLLAYLCCCCCCDETMMSDSDQYAAIMFLLDHGADPNRGNVLRWVTLRYYYNKCTESDFVSMFHCIIHDYGADVNFQDNVTGPFLIEAVHVVFSNNNNNNNIRSDITKLLSWSQRFIVTINTALEYIMVISTYNISRIVRRCYHYCAISHPFRKTGSRDSV